MKDMESTKSSLDKARQRFEDQREKLNKDTGAGRLVGRTNLNALQLSETDYPIIRGFKSLISPSDKFLLLPHHYHFFTSTSSILMMFSFFLLAQPLPNSISKPRIFAGKREMPIYKNTPTEAEAHKDLS